MKRQETKDEALERVKNANKADYANILFFALYWVPKQFKIFSSNDFKKAYLETNEPPIQPNVYGSVFNYLAKNEYIFRQGSINSKTPESKGCLIRTWISREYKEKQANNARNKSTLNLFD